MAVPGLRADSRGGGRQRFGWQGGSFADRYDITRASVLDPTDAICWTQNDTDPTDLEYVDTAPPPPGECWFFLIRGVDDDCGGPGPWSNGTISVDCP